MFIKAIGIALPEKRVTLGPSFLKLKKHMEDESSVSFYEAGALDTPFTLACKAVNNAIEKANLKSSSIGGIIFANVFLKDYSSWVLSSSICNSLGLKDIYFMDIDRGCCGIVSGIELAMDLMKNRNEMDMDNVVVVTSIVMPKCVGSHKDVDRGGIVSDGASACIVSRSKGKFEITGLDIKYNTSIADFIRVPIGGTKGLEMTGKPQPVDLKEIKDDFTKGAQMDFDQFHIPARACTTRALEKAGLTKNDITCLITPNYCRLYTSMLVKMFDHIPAHKTSIDVGMMYSHMGASDILLNLDHMDKGIDIGENILIHQDGAGFSFGGLVLKKC